MTLSKFLLFGLFLTTFSIYSMNNNDTYEVYKKDARGGKRRRVTKISDTPAPSPIAESPIWFSISHPE